MDFEKIFEVTSEEKLKIGIFYEKSENELEKVIKSIRKWIQTQPHLPQNQENYFIEMMLKLNKFNEEKIKSKIDMYYTMRNLIPEFYENRSPVCEEMITFLDTLMILPLPQLTEDLERVYLIKFINTDPSKYDLIQNARYLMAVFDIRLKFDQAIGERYIYDLSGLRIGHVLKINPLIIRKIYTAMEKAYSDRIKGIHFLHMPMIGNALISIAKMVLSEKLSNRVQCHKNIESLKEFIPSKILPSDYQGLQQSSDILYDRWRDAFSASKNFIEETGNQKSDESLRILNENNNSMFGGLFNIFGKHNYNLK